MYKPLQKQSQSGKANTTKSSKSQVQSSFVLQQQGLETPKYSSAAADKFAAKMLGIQAKLTIGAPGDKYEQEADRVARQVVQQIHAPAPQQTSNAESLQRQELGKDEDELRMKPERVTGITQMIQRQSDGAIAAPLNLSASIEGLRGVGQMLAESIQAPMEQAFGADFSGVRIHADSQADELNRSIQAKAFTTGQDVFFRQGAYEPGSKKGQELIAHELTHVVQQKNIKVNRVEEKEKSEAGGAKDNKQTMLTRVFETSTAKLQRKVYLDIEGKPDPKSIVYIVGVDRPATPDVNRITGVNAKKQAARHIIPDALMVRTFKARFSGKTVAELTKLIPHVAVDENYLINMAQALQDIYSYENTQINRGKGGKAVPPGAWKDSDRITLEEPDVDSRKIGNRGTDYGNYRNFWEGDATENEDKDKRASSSLYALEILSDTKFPGAEAGADRIKEPGWLKYQKSMEAQILGALSEEFDPPTNVAVGVIEEAAEEWARMTNVWLKNDLVSKSYYWPGRDLTWDDAFQSPVNKNVYKKAPSN